VFPVAKPTKALFEGLSELEGREQKSSQFFQRLREYENILNHILTELLVRHRSNK